MRNVRFLVDNKEVDFYNQSDLAPRVTKALFNAQNLDQVSGDYVINVKLPRTDKNREIFEFIDNLSTNKTFFDLINKPTSITVDGDTIVKGTLRLKKITSKDFECIITGNNIDWISFMRQKSIRDISSFRKPFWSGNKSINYTTWTDPSTTATPTVTPTWWNSTIGYSDLFDISVLPNGQTETDGRDYDFATPLISYGNFAWPRILGWIENGILNVVQTEGKILVGHTTPVVNLYSDRTPDTTVTALVVDPDGLGTYTTGLGAAANYGSTNDPIYFTIIKLGQFTSANRGGFYFYNANQPGGLIPNGFPGSNINLLFPAPYLVTTVKRMFEDYGYNTAGGFFNNTEYKNIIIPYTNNYEPFPWNWEIMARLNVDFRMTPFPFNDRINRFATANSYVLSPPPLTDTLTGNTATRITPAIGIQHTQQFYRFTSSPLATIASNTTDMSVIKNENYSYQEEFFDNNYAYSISERRYGTFMAPVDGKYKVRFVIDAFSAKDLLSNNQWYKSGYNPAVPGGLTDRFFFMLCKRGDNSFAGKNNGGLIHYANGPVNYITDDSNILTPPPLVAPFFVDDDFSQYNTNQTANQVIFVRSYNTTAGGFDGTGGAGSINLNTNSITVDIEVTEYFNAGETCELIFCVGNNLAISGGILSNQGFSLDAGSTVSLIVDPIDTGVLQAGSLTNYVPFNVQLNPALWLPDIGQDEFLKSVLNTWNLFLSYNQLTNTISIDNFETSFLPSGSAIDWTDKCSVLDKSTEISPLNIFKTIEWYEVVDSNDIYQTVQGFNPNGTIPTQSYTNNSPNFTEVKKINLLWSDTEIKEYNHVTANQLNLVPIVYSGINAIGTTIPIPTMSGSDIANSSIFEIGVENKLSYDFNVRILKYDGIQQYYSDVSGLWIEDVQYINGSSKLIPQASNLSLNYFDNWKKWLQLVMVNDNISLRVYLLSRDISNLDIRRPIKIGSDVYIINKVSDFNPIEQTNTKVNIFKMSGRNL